MVALTPTIEPQAVVTAGIRTEPARCCICGNAPSRTVARGRDFEYDTSRDEWRMDRCDSCGVSILNPRPSEDEFHRVYPPHYHAFQFNAKQFGFVYRVRRWLEARRLLALLREVPTDARILDVGCGDGFHLDLLREFGLPTWRLEGIDASERAVAHAKSRGLTVSLGTVADCAIPPNCVDAVILIMTVEHLSDPATTLAQIAKLLSPGGRLLVVTDNAKSIDTHLFGKRTWGGYHFPRHTYLFDKHSLAKLAVNAGFTTLRIRTIVSPVNWVYSIRNWLVDRRWPNWLVNQFSLTKPIPLAAFTILDNVLCLFNRGALLQGAFVKPQKGYSS